MPDLYGWIVFIHVAAVLIFFLAHGASAGMAFKLTSTRDRAALRALLEMSEKALYVLLGAFVVLVAAGIAAGFMGGYWGDAWIWISIAVLAVVFFAMTPMAGKPMRRLREAVQAEPGADTDTRIAELLDAWRPMPSAVLGVMALLVITWLMMFRPF